MASMPVTNGAITRPQTLGMAWFRKMPAPGLTHPSDRGSQYASHAFQAKLKAYGRVCSRSRKENCWDNAPTESGFNRFKNERVQGVRYATHDDMKAATFEVIEMFYNRKRQHSSLGYPSPFPSLDSQTRTQNQKKRVAGNPPLGRRNTERTSLPRVSASRRGLVAPTLHKLKRSLPALKD